MTRLPCIALLLVACASPGAVTDPDLAQFGDLAASPPGCGRDTDCKGNRICVEALCVDQGPDMAHPIEQGAADLATVDLVVVPDLVPTPDLVPCEVTFAASCNDSAQCCSGTCSGLPHGRFAGYCCFVETMECDDEVLLSSGLAPGSIVCCPGLTCTKDPIGHIRSYCRVAP